MMFHSQQAVTCFSNSKQYAKIHLSVYLIKTKCIIPVVVQQLVLSIFIHHISHNDKNCSKLPRGILDMQKKTVKNSKLSVLQFPLETLSKSYVIFPNPIAVISVFFQNTSHRFFKSVHTTFLVLKKQYSSTGSQKELSAVQPKKRKKK